jgi:hypothetical protein
MSWANQNIQNTNDQIMRSIDRNIIGIDSQLEQVAKLPLAGEHLEWFQSLGEKLRDLESKHCEILQKHDIDRWSQQKIIEVMTKTLLKVTIDRMKKEARNADRIFHKQMRGVTECNNPKCDKEIEIEPVPHLCEECRNGGEDNVD